MGSAKNFVGYHVAAHLALHRWFRSNRRPVPGFLFFDQPSQAHYPPDQDNNGALDSLPDEDQVAVRELFQLISNASAQIGSGLQVIVLDHANIDEPWFANAIVEEWRRGVALVPQDWFLEPQGVESFTQAPLL